MSARAIFSKSSKIQSTFKSISQIPNFFKSTSQSNPSSFANSTRRISRIPVETSCCLLTMLPLHSAISSARLQSVLSVDSLTWCLVPQGMSMPL